MDMDIIIYAVVAAILLIRLWTILGRRDSDDVTRPNPFVAPPAPSKEEDAPFADAGTDSSSPPQVFRPLTLPPASLAGGLEKIHSLDPSFDEKSFLQGARLAFTMIIENFAKNNLAPIQRFLGENVLPHFQAAIAERQKSGQTLECKIDGISEAEVTAAWTEQSQAFLTVRFVSQQENVLKDAGGHIVGGELGAIQEVTDVWTFARDIKAEDPNWILIETHV